VKIAAAITRALSALCAVTALAACAPTATPPAVPATTTQAPAPSAVPPTARATTTAVPPATTPTAAQSATTVPPAGVVFSFNGVQVTLPATVAQGAGGRSVAAAQEPGAPEFAIHPAYTEVLLNGYPAQNAHLASMIQVLPVADYVKISPVAGQRVQALQALLAAKPAVPDQEIPLLPVYNAAQVFRAQVRYLGFSNGAGVRFVTMYAQGFLPATNQEVFYTYQGLTSDGAYWVSAVLPVNAAWLAPDANSASNPPAGGIAFPANPDGTQLNTYYRAVTDKLNATPAGQFTPSLEALDAMMQSLRITGQ
jgi:hypothetical protein